jgi:hypothetical protein
MRRALVAGIVIGIVALALLPAPAPASPGPNPNVGPFDVIIREALGPGSVTYDVTSFETSHPTGWDWGLRAAYSCLYVEFYLEGVRAFEVHYETVQGYPGSVQILDDAGAREPVNGSLGPCGDGLGPGASMPFDGTDHFPHATDLVFYAGGSEIARIDYSGDECSWAYWTPGDEAGEAWLWWDADGPTETMPGHHACDGGPGEPEPIVRAFVQNLAPGVDVCSTDALQGDLCTAIPEPEPSPSPSVEPTEEPSPSPTEEPSPTAVEAPCFAGVLSDGQGNEIVIDCLRIGGV